VSTVASSALEPTSAPPDCAERPGAPLTRLLDELASVLRRMPAPTYTARPFAPVSGSIGQHVRHILDHVADLCNVAPPGVLSYDRRTRGTDVEADPHAALQAIARLRVSLSYLDHCDAGVPITLASVVEHGASPVSVRSTLGREILFVISHTIHHQALIAILLSAADCRVPAAFGLAASTPRPVHA
jgi:uncharacterized damage-inducible protein DinB